jgi:uncharacterized OsmC-like protein
MIATVMNRHVNQLDLAALAQTVDAIENDPAQGLTEFRVTTRWTGQTRSESTVDGFTLGGERIARSHKIVADEPCQLLGTDSAPNPQELLMAAFNACITVGYVAGAALKGIELDSLEIETHGQLDLRGFLGLSDEVPPGYQKIEYEVRIKGDGSTRDFEDIHQTVMKTSPNYFNMSRPIAMDGVLTVN